MLIDMDYLKRKKKDAERRRSEEAFWIRVRVAKSEIRRVLNYLYYRSDDGCFDGSVQARDIVEKFFKKRGFSVKFYEWDNHTRITPR